MYQEKVHHPIVVANEKSRPAGQWLSRACNVHYAGRIIISWDSMIRGATELYRIDVDDDAVLAALHLQRAVLISQCAPSRLAVLGGAHPIIFSWRHVCRTHRANTTTAQRTHLRNSCRRQRMAHPASLSSGHGRSSKLVYRDALPVASRDGS